MKVFMFIVVFSSAFFLYKKNPEIDLLKTSGIVIIKFKLKNYCFEEDTAFIVNSKNDSAYLYNNMNMIDYHDINLLSLDEESNLPLWPSPLDYTKDIKLSDISPSFPIEAYDFSQNSLIKYTKRYRSRLYFIRQRSRENLIKIQKGEKKKLLPELSFYHYGGELYRIAPTDIVDTTQFVIAFNIVGAMLYFQNRPNDVKKNINEKGIKISFPLMLTMRCDSIYPLEATQAFKLNLKKAEIDSFRICEKKEWRTGM